MAGGDTKPTQDAEDEWDRIYWQTSRGMIEMRGGLRRGHQHMAFISEPDLRCPACVKWAEELQQIDGGVE